MLKNFFRKDNKEDKSKIKLDEINALFMDEKYDEVISKALPLVNDKDNNVSFEFKLKIALSYFRKGNYKESLELFEKVALIKNDVGSWFNVITSAILSNEIQKGKNAFNKCLELQEISGFKQQPSVPFIRYYYACALNDVGLFNEALEQLSELKNIYMQLVITDDTFVYIRGVPFMSHTLDLARKVFNGLRMDFSHSEWLKELKQKVDDDGKEIIEKFYEKSKP